LKFFFLPKKYFSWQDLANFLFFLKFRKTILYIEYYFCMTNASVGSQLIYYYIMHQITFLNMPYGISYNSDVWNISLDDKYSSHLSTKFAANPWINYKIILFLRYCLIRRRKSIIFKERTKYICCFLSYNIITGHCFVMKGVDLSQGHLKVKISLSNEKSFYKAPFYMGISFVRHFNFTAKPTDRQAKDVNPHLSFLTEENQRKCRKRKR
jgi:hypothetical protein